MKKVLKVAGKLVGGYAILNTLTWAWVGLGRYFNDSFSDPEFSERVQHPSTTEEKISYASGKLSKSFYDGEEGWKTLYEIIKSIL